MSSSHHLPPSKSTAQPSSRRKLFKLHSWVGFHLAFFMTLVLATGSIATVSNEIDWLIHDDMRVTPGIEKVSWQTMTNAIQDFAPDSNILDIKNMGADYFAYRAVVKNQANQRRFIHVNQWTGDVTGTTGSKTVQLFFRDLHRNFFTPNIIGIPIVSSMAIILLISLYTGLKTSRNWKTLMTRVRFNKGSRILIGDAHKAAGIWGIWFILLMAITGIWYFIEFGFQVGAEVSKTQSVAFQLSRPSISDDRMRSFGHVIPQRSTRDIIEATHQAFPEITVSRVFFPSKPNQAIRVFGTRDNPILRPRANQIILDPESLEPLIIHRSEEIRWVSWINEIADPLHFGFFGGLITKLIWFIFGVALTGLSVSGVFLTWRRLKTKLLTKTQLATAPILITALFLSINFINKSPPYASYSKYVMQNNEHKPLNLELHVGKKENQDLDGKLTLLISAENGIANIKNISIDLKKDSETISSNKRLKLTNYAKTSVYQSSLPVEKLKLANELITTLYFNNGESIINHWPVTFNSN